MKLKLFILGMLLFCGMNVSVAASVKRERKPAYCGLCRSFLQEHSDDQKCVDKSGSSHYHEVGCYDCLIKIEGKQGLQAHHLIPQSVLKVFGIDRKLFPSVILTFDAHKKTLSWGNSNEGKELRQEEIKVIKSIKSTNDKNALHCLIDELINLVIKDLQSNATPKITQTIKSYHNVLKERIRPDLYKMPDWDTED